MFNKAEFINEFVQYYMEIAETSSYEFSVVFNDYINLIVARNNIEINEFIFRKYQKRLNNAKKISNLKKKVKNLLFERLYYETEQAVIDKYDSEANTDIEND